MKTVWLPAAMALAVTCCLLSASVAQESAGDKNRAGLKDGWQQENEVPELRDPSGDILLRSAKVRLWVEQDWLCVRRTAADGAAEWQVALAQPIEGVVPTVETDNANLGITYGHYFVRENRGRLRIMRQRKDAKSPAWPKFEMNDPIEKSFGSAAMRARSVELKAFVRGGWCWVASGMANDRPDIWLRLQRKELQKPGYGFEGGPIPARMFFGRHEAMDEGDLFVATRSPAEISERVLAAEKLRKEFDTKPAPAIAASKWFNSPSALSLEKLGGNVVLLDFWGTWCGPCVKKLPDIEALHKKYSGRGLVVIGVHSEQAGDSVAAFLEQQPLSFPIAVDTGETAKNYVVDSWPTYFLIDKTGKAQWGFSSSPPSDAQIEALLR